MIAVDQGTKAEQTQLQERTAMRTKISCCCYWEASFRFAAADSNSGLLWACAYLGPTVLHN